MATKDQVGQILTKVLGPGVDISEAKQGEASEWDSLASLSILLELEEVFDVELSEDEVAGLTSLDEIVAILESR